MACRTASIEFLLHRLDGVDASDLTAAVDRRHEVVVQRREQEREAGGVEAVLASGGGFLPVVAADGGERLGAALDLGQTRAGAAERVGCADTADEGDRPCDGQERSD